MVEGVRLKNQIVSENSIHQPTLQLQHPRSKTVPENTFKETATNNNIESTITNSSQEVVLDYLLASQKGEINNKKLKIGDKTYNFERNKPLSQILTTKFNKIKQTMDYKKYELKEKRGLKWVNLDKNKALRGIQMRFKATTTDEQSAFKNYTNSFAINNNRVRGVKALQYLKYQDLKLKEYLRKHKGMKVLLETFNTFKSKKTNEEVRRAIRSRRY